jgi:D-alanine-D-alanine ligase
MHVAVVEGGPSTEAEVSRASARGVGEALTQANHRVTHLELEPAVCERLRTGGFDVVFPVVHGAVGEDGSLQGLLEVLGAPYVGSDVLSSALAMNKAIARVVLGAAGCPLARGVAEKRGQDAAVCARRAREHVGRALVVKPASSGSAIGVERLMASASDDDVAAALVSVWQLDEIAIIEELIVGREVTCSVLDVGGSARVLAATEIVSPQDAFYSYEARYAPARSQHTCPAELGEALTKRVHEVALQAHTALGCRDLSRADFIVSEAAFVLLEVNTLPGMTATSLYPEAAKAVGLSFPALCDALVTNAHRRGSTARNPARAFPT